MNWYSNYKSDIKEIIETVANEIKKSEIAVEKDLIQSLFLYELSKVDLSFVFKGGTPLSKAYGLTLDSLLQRRNGIKNKNMPDLMIENEDFD